MEKIVSGIFTAQDIDFPIKKLVISRNGYIDYPGTAVRYEHSLIENVRGVVYLPPEIDSADEVQPIQSCTIDFGYWTNYCNEQTF